MRRAHTVILATSTFFAAAGFASPALCTVSDLVTTSFAPEIAGMAAAVDTTGYLPWIRNLSGVNAVTVGGQSQTFATRYTRTTQCRLAEQYVYEQFQAMGYTDVQYDPFMIGSTQSRNVIATLPGAVSPERVVILGGHLDSISPELTKLAPGANDNASGIAAILEAARVLRNYHFHNTIRFIAFTGEEQALNGSEHYAQAALARGDSIVGVVITDMIGWYDQHYRVEIQGEPPWDWLMQIFNDACHTYTALDTDLNYTSKRSDHVSFQGAGYAALLAVEDEWQTYPDYHQVTDTADKITPQFAVDVARAALATVAHVAMPISELGAPPSPRLLSPSDGSYFTFGQRVAFTGSATDAEDGTLRAGALVWQVDLHHAAGVVPVLQWHIGKSGGFEAADPGDDPRQVFYRIRLSVTDSAGLMSETSVDVFPDPSQFGDTPPSITSSAGTTAILGQQYIYEPQAAGTAPLGWKLLTAPSWLAVEAGTGRVSGTPTEAGPCEIVLAATNAVGTDSQAWTLDVLEAGSQQAVVPIGATWRYFKGNADPGSDWMQPSYADATWLAGPSGFGYGDGDDTTLLADMRFNYTTLFTRTEFELEDAGAVSALAILYDYDDGFAVYLNGQQLLSSNAPDSITHTSVSTGAREADGILEQVEFTDAATLGLLHDGTNLLAAVGLNDGLESSDFTLKIALDVTGAIHVRPTDASAANRLTPIMAWPNPFRGTVAFALDVPGTAQLQVYDVAGRLVRSISTPAQGAGAHSVYWDGRDGGGRSVASGVYYYRLRAPGFEHWGKLVRILP